jgi:O-antigen/teichoic acid export membrane protein
LIERKEDPQRGSYGGLIQTGFWVNITQSGLVLLAGLVLAKPLVDLFSIPSEFQSTFLCLVRWQAFITATMVGMGLFPALLYAHQRTDLIKYSQAASLVVGLGTLWLALYCQSSVASILWANAAAMACVVGVQGLCCLRLKLFPQPSEWGRPSWLEFKGLFSYGKDVFVTQIGSVLLMAAQPIVVSRSLGLEAVALWAIGTKAFFLLCSLMWQAFDISTPAFSEMLVRGEMNRLRKRYTDLLIVTIALAGVGAVFYAACNSAFVMLWTQGRFSWPAQCGVLLGFWMIISALIHSSAGFIILTKQIGAMRYIFLIEGVVFFGIASLVTHAGGLVAMIMVSLLCSLSFSGGYCLWRINLFFGFRPLELALSWLRPLGNIFAVLVPVSLGGWWLTSMRPSLGWLVLSAGIICTLGGYLFLRLGVPRELRIEMIQLLPPALRSVLVRN